MSVIYTLFSPHINLVLKTVCRRYIGHNTGNLTFTALILAFRENGTRKRIRQNSFRTVGIGIDSHVTHATVGNIFFKLCKAYIFGYRIVIDIKHAKEKHYYYSVGPVHAEFYPHRLFRLRVVVGRSL